MASGLIFARYGLGVKRSLGSSMGDIELLKKLKGLGVMFAVSVPGPWGSETHAASSDELMVLLQDPALFYAKYYGVDRAEYIGWAEDNFSVLCASTTSKGKPCKKVVTGGANVSPKIWVQMQGEYCVVHGEGHEF